MILYKKLSIIVVKINIVLLNIFGEIEMFTTSPVAAVHKVKGHYERK